MSYNFFAIFLLFLFANSLLFVKADVKNNNNFLSINNDVFLNKSTESELSFLDFWSVVMVDDKYDKDIKEVLIEYTVVPGDNLSAIATRFWTTVSNITKVNWLKTSTLRAWKRLYITPVEWFIITLDKVTNTMVFANINSLDLENLMTTNWITDKLQLLPKGDDLFIPISREKWIEIWLLEEPKPIIPIVKKPIVRKNTIILKKTTKNTVSNARYVASSVSPVERTYSSSSYKQPHIISQWTYSASVINWFYKWQCTWYAALNATWAFPYINDKRQYKSRRWDAKKRFDGAKRAWFATSPRPSVWAIMVIGWWAYGHVTMIKEVDWIKHKILVQWMNFLKPYVVTKRRIYMDKSMTKVIANSKYVIWFIPKQQTPQRVLDEVKKLKKKK